MESIARTHSYIAVAFVENLDTKLLATHYPAGRSAPHELRVADPGGGEFFLFDFGAMVFRDIDAARRDEEIGRLRAHVAVLRMQIVNEEFLVLEGSGRPVGINEGRLHLDQLTGARSGVIALTLAQSVAMESHERLVDQLARRSSEVIANLKRTGRLGVRGAVLNRFTGEALSVRTEVTSVLHLLDKPDATWDDPTMDRIYDGLRDEFDLRERFLALQTSLDNVVGALQFLTDIVRDRRMLILEISIVGLFVLEILMSLFD